VFNFERSVVWLVLVEKEDEERHCYSSPYLPLIYYLGSVN